MLHQLNCSCLAHCTWVTCYRWWCKLHSYIFAIRKKPPEYWNVALWTVAIYMQPRINSRHSARTKEPPYRLECSQREPLHLKKVPEKNWNYISKQVPRDHCINLDFKYSARGLLPLHLKQRTAWGPPQLNLKWNAIEGPRRMNVMTISNTAPKYCRAIVPLP